MWSLTLRGWCRCWGQVPAAFYWGTRSAGSSESLSGPIHGLEEADFSLSLDGRHFHFPSPILLLQNLGNVKEVTTTPSVRLTGGCRSSHSYSICTHISKTIYPLTLNFRKAHLSIIFMKVSTGTITSSCGFSV